jgi:hydrogenase maturation protease
MLRVIACGNLDARDDAAGLLAVRRARPILELIPGVEVVEAPTGFHVLDLLHGADAAIMVDAVVCRGPRRPGRVVRLRAVDGNLRVAGSGSLSSHGMNLAEAVRLAGALGEIAEVTFLGMEVEDVSIGDGLSERAAAGLPALVGAILIEAGRLVEGMAA